MKWSSGVDGFLAYLRGVRRRTDQVLGVMEGDDMDWAPAEGAFTVGDLVRHLAALERWMFAENVHGRRSRYPGHGKELTEGFDSTMAFFDHCRAESWEMFAALSDARYDGTCVTPGGAELKVRQWLQLMVEHEIHHRGQLYLMARMRGRPAPPLYGMTSEEVAAVSGRAPPGPPPSGA